MREEGVKWFDVVGRTVRNSDGPFEGGGNSTVHYTLCIFSN